MFYGPPSSLTAHAQLYVRLASTVIVLIFFYIAYIDFKTFRIPNRSLVFLLLIGTIESGIAGRLSMLLGDGLFAVLVAAICLVFYSRNVLGGGDVKLLPLAYFLVGVRCALTFSFFLIVFVITHYTAARSGWGRFHVVAGRRMMPYAPSIACAFLATMLVSSYLAGAAR